MEVTWIYSVSTVRGPMKDKGYNNIEGIKGNQTNEHAIKIAEKLNNSQCRFFTTDLKSECGFGTLVPLASCQHQKNCGSDKNSF